MKKTSQPCRWYLVELPGYLTGELAPVEALRVEQHLEECPQCREDLDRFRSLEELLISNLEKPHGSRGFHDSFFRKLAVEVAAERRAKPTPLAQYWKTALVPIAAAATAAAMLLAPWSAREGSEPSLATPVSVEIRTPVALEAPRPLPDGGAVVPAMLETTTPVADPVAPAVGEEVEAIEPAVVSLDTSGNG